MCGNKFLCIDEWSNLQLRSNADVLERAIAEVNACHAVDGGPIMLNDFYDRLDLPPSEMGSVMGWYEDMLPTLRYGAIITEHGEPAITFRFSKNPVLIKEQ